MPKVFDRIQIRRDLAAAWQEHNPTLAAGEYGLETDTLLIKIGNGVNDWNHLRYLNKINPQYLEYDENGQIGFNAAFETLLNSFVKSGDTVEHLLISNDPTLPEEIANKHYVDEAISAAGTLKRQIVTTLPDANVADENTIYLIKDNNIYHEYMLIENQMEPIGSGTTMMPVATENTLGGVKSSPDISVSQDGFMTINRVSTSTLYVPDGDSFTIRSGNAT